MIIFTRFDLFHKIHSLTLSNNSFITIAILIFLTNIFLDYRLSFIRHLKELQINLIEPAQLASGGREKKP
jgi:hypothetical protein